MPLTDHDRRLCHDHGACKCFPVGCLGSVFFVVVVVVAGGAFVRGSLWST